MTILVQLRPKGRVPPVRFPTSVSMRWTAPSPSAGPGNPRAWRARRDAKPATCDDALMPPQIRDADESDAVALGRFIIQQCARPEGHCIASWAGEGEAATVGELRSKLGSSLLYCIALDDTKLVGAVGCSVDEEHQTGWLRGPHVAVDGGQRERLSCAEALWDNLSRRIPRSPQRLTAYVDRENEFAIQFWRQHGLEIGEPSFVFEWRPIPGTAPPAPALRLSPLADVQEPKFRELYTSLFPSSWPGPEQILANREDYTCLVVSDATRGLAGFVVVGLEGDGEGRVYTLGVTPKRRRQGFGRQLLVGALAKLVERGAARVVLSVNDVNARARSLYEAVGFTQAYAGVALRGAAPTTRANTDAEGG